MGALRNQRHEAFCNLIARRDKTGMSNTACYIAAGYSASGNAAEAACSKLLSTAKVQARIAEINAPVIRKTRTTVDSLSAQFDEVFSGAMGSAQFGAAGQAAAAKAKLLGFMREKIEIGGPGAFDGLSDPEDVVRKLLDDTDDVASWPDVLRWMADEIERQLGDQAWLVTESAYMAVHVSSKSDERLNDINDLDDEDS
ncbi:hypothetical protein [Bradyrhizobium sp. SZCCHNS3004]|uniref:hypothetical protein n=1 Tax=Bradyrhizobium sp. SZCCHNS3004 TaxID=3057312 RepID=UPI002916C439|nr:hypothetical protein [Bradyrhizobium sp. SZCCHNS3004]